MTAPVTGADLEVAVSKLATKEELQAALDKLILEEIAPLREDVAVLKEKVSHCATKDDLARLREDMAGLKEKVDNCATKADLSDAMYGLTWRLLGGIAGLMGLMVALLRYLG